MTAIDATGLRAIEDVAGWLKKRNRVLLICGALSQPAKLMEQSEFHRHVGPDNILSSVDDALARARALRPPLTAATP